MSVQLSLFQLLEACGKSVANGRLPAPDLLTKLASKALGYAIIAGAAIVKVPQILTVLRSKSAEGLTFMSFELENIAFSIHMAYGFLMGLPFSAFGEAVLILAQNTFLLALIYYHAKAPLTRVLAMVGATAAGGAVALSALPAAQGPCQMRQRWPKCTPQSTTAAATAVALSGSLTTETLQALYDFNTVIMTAARVPQIWSNYKAKSTGQLSIFVFVMNFGGCLARIFTSIQEGGGIAMVRAYIIGAVLNFTLMAQILYYSKSSKTRLQAGSKGSAANGQPNQSKKLS